MADYGFNEKNIVFTDTDKRHADLKIRLQSDDLGQSDFFRAMITGYINKDQRIISFLYDWREKEKKYSKRKRKIQESSLKKGDKMISKFGINEEELENIFDMLEQEHPDL
jgi:hypothetical protein